MNTSKMLVPAPDPDGKRLYQAGGIAALVLGLAYIVIIALYAPMGVPPSGAEAWLAYMSGHTTTWWSILGLSVLTDLLFIPVTVALYAALKGIHKNAMVLAALFVGLFVVLDLALTWTNYAVLITLSEKYASAAGDVQRELLVTAAFYPSAVVESSLLDIYNTVTLAIGILIIGVVMLRSIFGRFTAWLGVTTGILGIAAVAGPFFISAPGGVIIIASTLTTIWIMFAGYRLYRLGSAA